MLRLEHVAIGIEITTVRSRHGANGIGRGISGKETMMERQSTHHSPRVDEAMERETRSLTQGAPIEAREEEWRMMEAPGDGEPLPDAIVSMDAVELRSLLATSLRPSAFPGDREGLLAVAEEEHAEPLVFDMLRALPAGRTYPTPEAVWEELGGPRETRTQPQPPPASEPEVAPSQQSRVEPPAETATPPGADQPQLEAPSAPLVVKGVALAVSVSVGAAALAIGVAREVCGRIRRLF
jgi:hypothetical protein